MKAVVLREDNGPILVLQQKRRAKEKLSPVGVPDENKAGWQEITGPEGLVMRPSELFDVRATFQRGLHAEGRGDGATGSTEAAGLP
jgi:hypothetical protein